MNGLLGGNLGFSISILYSARPRPKEIRKTLFVEDGKEESMGTYGKTFEINREVEEGKKLGIDGRIGKCENPRIRV